MKRIKKSILVALLTSITISLIACTVPVSGTRYHTLTQDEQVTHSTNVDLLAEMESNGVQVIQQGSRLILVLPMDKFFVLASTEIKTTQIPTLQLISLYLRNYIKTHRVRFPIKIYAFTDTVPMRMNRYVYSNQYAQVIGAFMWSHGFTPAQMRIVGFGAQHPIASNRTAWGSAYNRRILMIVN